MNEDTDLLEDRDDKVRILTLNRAFRKNALNTALCKSLLSALQRAEADDRVRAIVVTGSDGAFCAGADTKEFPNLLGDLRPVFEQRTRLLAELQLTLSKFPKPVVAACDGPTIGVGASLMLCCDITVASDELRLGFPEFRHGILPAMVLATLHCALPRPRALRLIALGDLLGAEEALHYGLVSHVASGPTALGLAQDLARNLATIDPALYKQGKALFAETSGLSFEGALHLGEAATIAARTNAL